MGHPPFWYCVMKLHRHGICEVVGAMCCAYCTLRPEGRRLMVALAKSVIEIPLYGQGRRAAGLISAA